MAAFCLFCNERTNNAHGFCSDECFEAHEKLKRACQECLENPCVCTHLDDEWSLDDEIELSEDNFRDDVEADADTLRSAGWGTDEDYGYCDW